VDVVELKNSQIIFFFVTLNRRLSAAMASLFLCPIINGFVRILPVLQLIFVENDKLGKLLPIRTDKGG